MARKIPRDFVSPACTRSCMGCSHALAHTDVSCPSVRRSSTERPSHRTTSPTLRRIRGPSKSYAALVTKTPSQCRALLQTDSSKYDSLQPCPTGEWGYEAESRYTARICRPQKG